MRRLFGVFVTAGLLAATACGKGGSTLTEVQRVKSGDLDVVLLSRNGGIRHGGDTFTVEFRYASGSLVDVGTVRGSATMPMPGMPMFGTLDVTETDTPGRYRVGAKFDMAGTWRISFEWSGSVGKGNVTFPGSVQ